MYISGNIYIYIYMINSRVAEFSLGAILPLLSIGHFSPFNSISTRLYKPNYLNFLLICFQ